MFHEICAVIFGAESTRLCNPKPKKKFKQVRLGLKNKLTSIT